ncbi:MAG TPA: SdrD B-like domain-containing protein [Gemmatimonadales bacterium]|nr:SdrD B-like domain-containing protein [Gemmatimonadales bacterium]
MGVVFEDLDGNGAQDVFSGEMGLAGWTVQLVWNGQVWATTTSDADGNFAFTGLGMTTYSVCLVAQGGYVQTLPVGAMADGCNGSGYAYTFTSQIGTGWVTNFGEMLQ